MFNQKIKRREEVLRTWVLYVLFMAEDRTLQHIAEKKFFETEQACYAHYNNNKESIDKSIYTIIRPRINKSHILHVGCMPTTAKMEIK